MAKAAAATALLDQQLDRLDGTRVDFDRGIRGSNDSLGVFNTNTRTASSSLDTFSGRMGIAVRAIGAFGPALAPIGAVAVPAVTGLANQFGFAAVAAGTAVLAFQGIGDTLTAVNKAALEPTADNLEAAHKALKELSPAGQALIGQLQEMRPIFTELRDTAAAGLFPGLIDGLESLERLAPSLTPILSTVGDTIGDLFAAGADSLTSNRWADFFAMLARDARPVLMDMGHALGDVVHGLSEMWEAFQPLNRSFGSWLADSARSFDEWAQGLSETEGFQEFVRYIQENGPKVAEAFGAISNAVVQIVQAAAPLGGPVLDAITGIADAIATLADSPLGTPIMAGVTALSAMTLAANTATAAVLRLKAAQASLGFGGGAAGATGVAASAGPAGAAGLVGILNIPDYLDNLEMMMSGERGVVEGFARMAGAAQPVGAVLQAFGVDILGTEDGDGFTGALGDAVRGQIELADSMSVTRDESRRFRHTFLDTNLEMLRNARRSERLAEVIKASNEQIRDAVSAWGDFSQKVELGGTSLDNVINRMDKLAEAARNQASNITKALERGVDPKAIRNIFDTLGPQGAVQVFDQLADASRDTVREVNKTFGSLQDGKRDVERALRGVDEAITGSREKLRGLNDVKVEPTADLDTKGLEGGVKTAESLLTGIDRKRAIPKVEAQSNVPGVVAQANSALMGIDGRTANTYIITHHITRRSGNDSAGGAPVPNGTFASGGYTGDGGKYEPAGVVHRGEVVLPQEIVKRDWASLKARYGHLPGFADGGFVRPLRSPSAQRLSINVTASELRGSISTPAGQLDLSAIIRAEAQDVYDQNRSFEQTQR